MVTCQGFKRVAYDLHPVTNRLFGRSPLWIVNNDLNKIRPLGVGAKLD